MVQLKEQLVVDNVNSERESKGGLKFEVKDEGCLDNGLPVGIGADPENHSSVNESIQSPAPEHPLVEAAVVDALHVDEGSNMGSLAISRACLLVERNDPLKCGEGKVVLRNEGA